MAAPVYRTDLKDIELDPGTGGGGSPLNWSALGGGGAGLNRESEYFIQGTLCVSKDAWGTGLKGMIYNSGVNWDGQGWHTGRDVFTCWFIHATPNSLATRTAGGVQALTGSGTGAFDRWYVAGSDTETFGGWISAWWDPYSTPDATTGSPTANTTTWIGGQADLPTTGPSKGSPWGIDAIRWGRGSLIATLGDAGNEANFANANFWSTDVTRRLGCLSFQKGSYQQSGRFAFGNTTQHVVFTDSNKSIVVRELFHVPDEFNQFDVVNTDSQVTLTNITFTSATDPADSDIAGRSSGYWKTNDNAQVSLTGCSFNNFQTFDFLANTVASGCTWNNCDTITAANSQILDCALNTPYLVANTSALVWDSDFDPDGKIDGCTFRKSSNNHHAIEFRTTIGTSVTLRNITSIDFNASNQQDDSFFHVKKTSGTLTINVIGGSGNFSYRSDGATVSIVLDPVTTSITTTTTTGTVIPSVRVLVEAANTSGDLPYQESVTIAQVGDELLANVAHTAHGLVSGDKVAIRGANETEYNGVFTISNVLTNNYEYTLPSDPGGDATGTITSTGVVLEGLTDGTGVISSSRTWTQPQPITGTARKSTSTPYYKAGSINGSIDNNSGFSTTVALVEDE